MADADGILLGTKLEALIDTYGIKELLFALTSVCWSRAAKVAEEGRDSSEWSELAVMLGTLVGM